MIIFIRSSSNILVKKCSFNTKFLLYLDLAIHMNWVCQVFECLKTQKWLSWGGARIIETFTTALIVFIIRIKWSSIYIRIECWILWRGIYNLLLMLELLLENLWPLEQQLWILFNYGFERRFIKLYLIPDFYRIWF